MRKAGIILAALMIGFILGTGALGRSVNAFYSGNQYLSIDPIEQLSYVAEVSDTIVMVADDATLHQEAIKYSNCKRGLTMGNSMP